MVLMTMADALHELVEERVVCRVKSVEGGQLDDAAYLALEDDREHAEVEGGGAAQTGADGDVVPGHILQHDLASLEGALPHQALPHRELGGGLWLGLVGVGSQELQAWWVLGLQQVEGAALGRHHRGELGEDQAPHGEEVLLAL
jgi:hypothetical protein